MDIRSRLRTTQTQDPPPSTSTTSHQHDKNEDSQKKNQSSIVVTRQNSNTIHRQSLWFFRGTSTISSPFVVVFVFLMMMMVWITTHHGETKPTIMMTRPMVDYYSTDNNNNNNSGRAEEKVASKVLLESMVEEAPTPLNGGCTSNGSFDAGTTVSCHPRRMRQTSVDQYFQKHGELPIPATIHATIAKPKTHNDKKNKKNILIIGDVHGCFHEMQELYAKALQENDNTQFDYVILTGDMNNKGPDSVKVVRWVREHYYQQHHVTTTTTDADEEEEQQRWLTVRGNNDNGALLASLGSPSHRKKKIHSWILEAEEAMKGGGGRNVDNNTTTTMLSDDDIMWLAELPYSITIPKTYFEDHHHDLPDITIVHAGLLPKKNLEEQDLRTLVEIRDAWPICHQNTIHGYHQQMPPTKKGHNSGNDCEAPIPWASAWEGPRHIIFGHDANRGLQQHPWATGLDTGAVFGKQMTGMILPERKLVSIATTKGCRRRKK